MEQRKTIRQIITDLNTARSNDCSKEKSEEIKGIIQFLLPYAEAEEKLDEPLLVVAEKIFYYKEKMVSQKRLKEEAGKNAKKTKAN